MEPLQLQTIVMTGTSSGIGLVTAKQAVKGDTDALRMAPRLTDATTASTRARLSPMRVMLPAATAFLLAVVARR